jgi:hypothetical protein
MGNPTADGWRRLSDHLELPIRCAESQAKVTISANQIRELTGREPRLMTKFDTRESRPSALSDLTLLPLTNGSYAILAGDGYYDVPSATLLKQWRAPSRLAGLATLPWKTGPTSESQALDMAYAAGVLHDFLEDPGACLTIRGRLRSPRFEFEFEARSGLTPLLVDGVQIEVDSGFEGDGVHLIEAKLGSRTNFHVRQLYYPLRMWSTLVAHKPVSTVFLSWSNRCFSLREFRFDPLHRYHGIVPGRAVDYYLDEPSKIPTLAELLELTREQAANATSPFPQADDVRRVVDVVDAVANGVTTRVEIASRYEFDERQADYYANAAAYLGLLERVESGFALKGLGQVFVSSPFCERQALVLRCIAERPVFRDVMQRVCSEGQLPSRAEIAELIACKTGLTGETPLRRARTVESWLKWATEAAAEPA